MTLEQQTWNGVAKGLHWLIFIMVLIEVPAGYLMASLYGPGLKHADVTPLAHLLAQIHHTNGFLLLGLVVVRLAWRFTHPAPPLPADLSVVQRGASRVTQALLYALLIGLPLSGWLALSVLADSPQFGKTNIWFFAIDGLMPRLIEPKPFNAPQGYAYYARFHIWFINAGAALLALHVGAALFHHFVRRDSVLRTMWPLAGRR
jgi:cytochrome b561